MVAGTNRAGPDSGTSRAGAANGQRVSAWRPRVPGVVEVFHARFTEHAYPMHVHDVWTLLIVDDGAVRYDLDRREHGTPHDRVTLLPPHVPHNGSPATAHGFRKRVLYLDLPELDESLIGAAVDGPDLADPLLRRRVGQVHAALAYRGDELEAESRLALIRERLVGHLRPRRPRDRPGPPQGEPGVAGDLRDLLDERLLSGMSLDEASGLLHAHPAHLVRAFTAAYGIAPHQYLTSRRLDRARRLLLDGRRPAEAAAEAGFYDQSHLNRHFKRLTGTTPGRYARSGPPADRGRPPADPSGPPADVNSGPSADVSSRPSATVSSRPPADLSSQTPPVPRRSVASPRA